MFFHITEEEFEQGRAFLKARMIQRCGTMVVDITKVNLKKLRSIVRGAEG